jgi:cupin 2 domain-containing protein
MTGVRRGRLRPSDDAPAAGERIEPVALLSGVRVEQILSGELADPADYLQDHDEWVVVLSGGAVLEIEGSEVRLSKGEWIVLPAGIPHRLVQTDRGTNWLTVRAPSPTR